MNFSPYQFQRKPYDGHKKRAPQGSFFVYLNFNNLFLAAVVPQKIVGFSEGPFSFYRFSANKSPENQRRMIGGVQKHAIVH